MNSYIVELTPSENNTLAHDLSVEVYVEADLEITAIMHAFWSRNIPTNWVVTAVTSDAQTTQHNLSYHGALRISQRTPA